MLVRKAEIRDTRWIVEELKEFSKFFGGKTSLFGDEEYVVQLVNSLTASHLNLIAEDEETGERLGFISGMVTQHVLNPKIRLLAELFWWVPEKHRGTKAGAALLDAYVAWGKQNVDWITMTLEADSPVSDICLTKRGFRPKEHSYYMERENQ